MKNVLNLDLIAPDLHEQAQEGYENGEANCLFLAPNDYWLTIIADNIWHLLERGIYEPGLLEAFTSCRVNHANWSVPALEFLFNLADPDNLQAAGDELPDGHELVIYRGVAGKGCRRRCRGFSWTLSLDQACWFANRSGAVFCLGSRGVVAATVQRDEILAFVDDRSEQEVIVRPTHYRRLKLPDGEIERRANAVSGKIQATNTKAAAI